MDRKYNACVDRRDVLKASGAVTGTGLLSKRTVAGNSTKKIAFLEGTIEYRVENVSEYPIIHNCGIKDYKKVINEDKIVFDYINKEVKSKISNNKIIINAFDYRSVPGVLFGDRKTNSLPIRSGVNMSELMSLNIAEKTRHPYIHTELNDSSIDVLNNSKKIGEVSRYKIDQLKNILQSKNIKVISKKGERRDVDIKSVEVTPVLKIRSFGDVEISGGNNNG